MSVVIKSNNTEPITLKIGNQTIVKGNCVEDSKVVLQGGNITNINADLTNYVPYTGATADVDLDTRSLNAKSLHVKGTNGQGHLGLKKQSADATAVANEISVFADSNGDLAVKNDGLYKSTFKTSSNSANRTYTFPNRNGTLADDTDLATKENTITAGTSSQYIKGNKTLGTFATDVLSSVSDSFGFINANLLPKVKLGWYVGEEQLNVGGFLYTDPTVLQAVETATSHKFQTTSVYDNIYFYDQGTNGKFNRKIKPMLDAGYNINFFCEFRGATPGGIAQLADVKNGTTNGGGAGDRYGIRIGWILDDINAYFTANPTKVGQVEVRLILMHEFQIGAYETGLAYNRSDANDWSSSASNPVLGVNDPADYLPAFARLSAIIQAHPSWVNKYVKICPNSNYIWSMRYKLADYVPPRSQYDYYTVDIYDRWQATTGASNFSANLGYIISKARNQFYNQIIEATDAPIVVTESASSIPDNDLRYSKVERYKRAFFDFMYEFPQIVEWTYFGTAGSEWAMTTSQLNKLAPLFNKTAQRLTEDYKKKITLNKSNLITKDLTQIGNWTVAGANAGSIAITTTTTPTTVGSDETNKSSATLSLSLTTAGTNPLLNHVYFTESASVFENNVPHIMSFQAYTDVAESASDVNIYAHVLNSTDTITELRGNFYQKLTREATTLYAGVTRGDLTGTVRVALCFGHNSNTTGNVYIIADTIKIEKGEMPTLALPSSATTLTTNTAQTVTAKKTFSSSTSGAVLALTGTSPTSPTNGDVWIDSSNNLLAHRQNGIIVRTGGTLFTNINNATVASTTTETDIVNVSGIGTVTLPANFFVPGKLICIELGGVFSTTTGTNTLTIRAKLGSTTLVSTGAITLLASQTNRYWGARVFFLGRSAPSASSSVSASGKFEYNEAGAIKIGELNASGSTNIDTTATQVVSVTAQWSVANASNSIQARLINIQTLS